MAWSWGRSASKRSTSQSCSSIHALPSFIFLCHKNDERTRANVTGPAIWEVMAREQEASRNSTQARFLGERSRSHSFLEVRRSSEEGKPAMSCTLKGEKERFALVLL